MSVAVSTPITTTRPVLAPPNAPAPKIAPLEPLAPDAVGSMEDLVRPDDMLSSSMDLDPMDDEPVQLHPLLDATSNAGASRQSAAVKPEEIGSAADDALIDLCHVGNGSEDDTDMEDTTASHFLPDPSSPEAIGNIDDASSAQSTRLSSVTTTSTAKRRTDRADPALMERLAEALAVLPKEMQEQIVERLIAAITTTDLFTAPLLESTTASNLVPSRHTDHDEEGSAVYGDDASSNADGDEEVSNRPAEVGMPLAAATLAALLSHYSAEVKKHSAAANASSKAKNNNRSIPVIPVHA